MAGTYTKAQKKATTDYLKKLKSISIRVKPEEAEKYKKAASDCGLSLREFILKSMDEKIERSNTLKKDGV